MTCCRRLISPKTSKEAISGPWNLIATLQKALTRRAMAELLTDFVMEAEVTAKVGAEAHERIAERTTRRNGHRERRWDTRLGTLQLQVPKLRERGYVPSSIEHRKRSEQA
jgi:transposase-like protein